MTRFELVVLKPIISFPFALIEYLSKGKCKGSWKEFKKMAIDEIEEFLKDKAKYRIE